MSAGPARPLRVGVIGTGGWGHHHARIFAGRADTILCGVVGRDPDRTAARAHAYDTTPYTSIEQLVVTQHPDLITVCLPNQGHFEVTLQLLDTRIPLLVEKPLVFDLDEADRLLARADQDGTFFAINFNHRYAEPVRRAAELITTGVIGTPVFASWRFGGEGPHDEHPHGNLIETQCHGFDLLEHLVAPIRSVAAQMASPVPGVFSTMALACEFDTGAVGTLVGSYDSSYAYPDTQLVEINGSAGRLVIHDTVRALSWSRAGDPVEHRWHSGYFDDEARTFAATFDRHVDAVLAALRAGDPPPVPATAGRRALHLALAAIESHRTGARVETPAS